MSINKNVAVVVRADGTVPFDAGVDPAVKDHIIRHLIDRGHSVAPIEGTDHYKVAGWHVGKEV